MEVNLASQAQKTSKVSTIKIAIFNPSDQNPNLQKTILVNSVPVLVPRILDSHHYSKNLTMNKQFLDECLHHALFPYLSPLESLSFGCLAIQNAVDVSPFGVVGRLTIQMALIHFRMRFGAFVAYVATYRLLMLADDMDRDYSIVQAMVLFDVLVFVIGMMLIFLFATFFEG